MKNRKEENLGKLCLIKGVKLVKTAHGGWPAESDIASFIIVEVVKGGYHIQNQQGNVYEVKTNLIKICE